MLRFGIISRRLWREIRTFQKNIYENNLSGNFALTYYNNDSYEVGNLRFDSVAAIKKSFFW